MNNRNQKVVKADEFDLRVAYIFPEQWRKRFGQIVEPLDPSKSSYSKFEAATVIVNEWSEPPDIKRWARQFNWSHEDVSSFICEIPTWLEDAQ